MTGVQTCALPIYRHGVRREGARQWEQQLRRAGVQHLHHRRAPCERADGEAAADHLAERGQVAVDPVALLRDALAALWGGNFLRALRRAEEVADV